MTTTVTETAPLSYRIPAWLKAELQKLADADRRSLGPYLVLVMEQHVEAAKKRKDKR